GRMTRHGLKYERRDPYQQVLKLRQLAVGIGTHGRLLISSAVVINSALQMTGCFPWTNTIPLSFDSRDARSAFAASARRLRITFSLMSESRNHSPSSSLSISFASF